MGFGGIGNIISGIGNAVTGNWAGLAGNIGTAIDSGVDAYSAYAAYDAERDKNAANERMFNQNLQWQGQAQQNAFSHDREMATAQMGFQDYQSKTQYQRSMADMQTAGLNPVLAASRGGNDAMSGSAPTSSGGGGSAIPQQGNPISAGMAGATAAASIRNMHEQNELISAQRRNVDAQTATELNRPENVRAETSYKTASAKEADQRVVKLIEEADKLRDEINAQGPKSQADLNRAHAQLARVTAELRALDIPEARAYAEMYKTPLGTKIPYKREVERTVSTATGAVRDLGNLHQRKRFNDYVIEGK